MQESTMDVDFTSFRDPERLRSESIHGSERFFSVATTTSSCFTESYSTPFEHTPPRGSSPPATTFIRRKLEDYEYEERGAIKQEEFEEDNDLDFEDSVLKGLGLEDTVNSQLDKIVERMKQINLTGKVKRTGEYPVAVGGFGEIWQGVSIRKQVAIKVTRRRSSKPDQISLKRAAREMSAWNCLKHKHIMPLLGFVVETGGWVSLVSPWQQNGKASEFLVGKSWKILMNVIVGACLGLRYLHTKGMAHGDFRGDNILIDHKGSAVLNDFGLTRMLQTSLFKTTATAGNPAWTAPELLLAEDGVYTHTYATDVWACGMTILELIWGERPYGKLGDGAIAIALNNRQLPSHPYPKHEPIWEICSQCWDFTPESRVNIRQIVKLLKECIEYTPPVQGCAISSIVIEGWIDLAASLLDFKDVGLLKAAEELAHSAATQCKELKLAPGSSTAIRSIWLHARIAGGSKGVLGSLYYLKEPSWSGSPYVSRLTLCELIRVCGELGWCNHLGTILDYYNLGRDSRSCFETFDIMCAVVEATATADDLVPGLITNILELAEKGHIGFSEKVVTCIHCLAKLHSRSTSTNARVFVEQAIVGLHKLVMGEDDEDTFNEMQQLSNTYQQVCNWQRQSGEGYSGLTG